MYPNDEPGMTKVWYCFYYLWNAEHEEKYGKNEMQKFVLLSF